MWEGRRDVPVTQTLVPPTDTSGFCKTSYWQARGKLDVPKERFILYPVAGRETDPTSLLGWAVGTMPSSPWRCRWSSAPVRSTAGRTNGRFHWSPASHEPQPWVEQWHSDVEPTHGVSLAAFCRDQLVQRCRLRSPWRWTSSPPGDRASCPRQKAQIPLRLPKEK